MAGLAVAGRLRAHGGQALIGAELLEAFDGVVAGVVIGEDLGQEQAERDPGGVEAVPPGMMTAAAGLLDGVAREELEERQPLLVSELVAR